MECTTYNESNQQQFFVWVPPTIEEIKKEDELKKKQEIEKKKEVVVDIYTENYIDELRLRPRSQSKDSDVEQIDFSFLDYDAVDFPVQDSKPFSGIQSTATKTDMEISNIIKEPDSISMNRNATLSAQQEIYKTNLTFYILLNQSKSENATWIKNSSASPEDKSIDTSVAQMKDNTSTKAEVMNSTQTIGNKTSERIIQTENMHEVSSKKKDPSSNGTNEMVQLDIEDQTGSALNNESEIHLGSQLGAFGDGINATVLPEIKASSINDTETFYKVTQLTNDILSNVSEVAISEEMHNQTRRKVEIELEGIINVTKTKNSLHKVTKTENRNQNYSFGNETKLQLNSSSSAERFLNETSISGSSAHSSNQLPETSSEDLSDSVSLKEIYLQNHSSNAIRTRRLDAQGHNYDGTHQTVPLEIPNEIVKHHGYDAPLPEAQTTLTPIKKPKTKIMILRQPPQKGQSMKIKKRQKFKTLPRSSLPVSPLGFNPGMSPRRIQTNGPQIQPGVHQSDWSDYELNNVDNLDDYQGDVQQDEYEYVSYKDPYGSTEDMQSFTLDEITKYYLETMGENVKTYFISAEEVEWDYAGYGQR